MEFGVGIRGLAGELRCVFLLRRDRLDPRLVLRFGAGRHPSGEGMGSGYPGGGGACEGRSKLWAP